MKLRSPYNSLLILSIVLAAAFLAGWAIVVYESYSMKGEIAKISQAADDVAAKDARLLSLRTTLRDSKDDVALLDNIFVTKDGIPEFIDMLDMRAQSSGVKADIGSINLDDSDGTHLRTLRLHISGQGTWRDDMQFISFLETLPYALEMDGLSINKTDSKATETKSSDQKSSNVDTKWSWGADLSIKVANDQ